MRFSMGLLAGLVAVGLVGCANSAAGPSAARSPTALTKTEHPHRDHHVHRHTGHRRQASRSHKGTAGHLPAAAQVGHAGAKTTAGARATAARFFRLYFGSQFAASWDLLASAAKRQVPRDIWVKVHDGCPSASAGVATAIKSVTVFGNAAIISERLAGVPPSRGTAEGVFNYIHGRWGYSPDDLNIYQHRSVAADIAAAKAAGFCAGRKNATL
jgi:hypothetical protein